jgi:tetratricopeptide (TPR) repeat protein
LDLANAEACHELGYIHKSLGNHEKAIEALQKELGLDSSFTFS